MQQGIEKLSKDEGFPMMFLLPCTAYQPYRRMTCSCWGEKMDREEQEGEVWRWGLFI